MTISDTFLMFLVFLEVASSGGARWEFCRKTDKSAPFRPRETATVPQKSAYNSHLFWPELTEMSVSEGYIYVTFGHFLATFSRFTVLSGHF